MLLLTASGAAAQESAADSSRAFVQRFYDTYLKEGQEWADTVRKRPGLFEPSLAQALRDDAEAQAKVQGDSVGLDFDPFLGSQDPGPRFEARGVTAIPGGQRLAVFDLMSPKKPMALVEVAAKGGSWTITNIRYPGTAGDLRAILKALKKERQR